jgi:hypothetical protein
LLRELRKACVLLGSADIEYAGFWVASRYQPMDGPSRGREIHFEDRIAGPLRYDFEVRPLATESELQAWEAGTWSPSPAETE